MVLLCCFSEAFKVLPLEAFSYLFQKDRLLPYYCFHKIIAIAWAFLYLLGIRGQGHFMKQFGLRPRAAPLLKNFFELASVETQLYAASLIDPVGETLGDKMKSRGNDGPPEPPSVQNAYRNHWGDIFFNVHYTNWYVLPKNSNEAFKIGTGDISAGTVSAAFKHELTGKLIGVLKANADQNLAVLACCLDESVNKTTYTVQLERLSAPEKAALTQAIRCRKISFVGIPEVRALESAFRKQNGNLLVVSCNRSDYSYDALRVFTGPSMQELREIPVAKVERFRDGGSTFFYTERGILYSPAGMDSLTVVPKWQGGCNLEFQQDLRDWTDEKSGAEKLTRLNAAEMAAQVKDDPRLIGAQIWGRQMHSLPRPDVI